MKTLAIVGSAITGRNALVNTCSIYDDIWTLAWDRVSSRYSTLMFDMHPIVKNRNYGSMTFEDYIDHLYRASLNGQLILANYDNEIYRAKLYPIDKVIKTIGRNYFLSSLGYMLGYAIYLNEFNEIHFIGIDFEVDKTRFYQLANLEYLCGVAEGRGIKIIPHYTSDMLGNPYMYGYHFQRQMTDKNEKTER